MKPHQAFEVLIRAIGVITILYGGFFILYAISRSFGLVYDSRAGVAVDALVGIAGLIAGAVLLFGASVIVQIIYGPDANSK